VVVEWREKLLLELPLGFNPMKDGLEDLGEEFPGLAEELESPL
jgi:hypothetical protein